MKKIILAVIMVLLLTVTSVYSFPEQELYVEHEVEELCLGGYLFVLVKVVGMYDGRIALGSIPPGTELLQVFGNRYNRRGVLIKTMVPIECDE